MSLFVMPRSTVRLTEHWHVAKDGDPAGLALYERHYSSSKRAKGEADPRFAGPGSKIVLLTEDNDALFVWRHFIESMETEPKGINCAVFRNESRHRASDLIREAERVAWCRWPGERLYTYVNPAKVKTKGKPGWCFLKAGWRYCGTTKGGLLTLEKHHSPLHDLLEQMQRHHAEEPQS